MIKDIVNRDLVNLQNCESEPIHIPGSIQTHGFLIGINSANSTIEYCSGNINSFIGVSHLQILGKSAETLFGASDLAALLKVANENSKAATTLEITLDEKQFTATIHKSGKNLVVECEPVLEAKKSTITIYEQTARFLYYMNETHSLQELCKLVADGTREITGYDRVMVYRFDEAYNGEVFAESCTDEVEPFLGLHYPHTDIPAQARDLYLKNLLRLIGDVYYSPVPIYTIDDRDNKSLDLSLSILRSSSPIHMQYLQNMGVAATLTISLIHQGKLWGLIACHHYSEKVIDPELRLAAQLQGHFITSQIELRQQSEEYQVAIDTDAALSRINSMSLPHSRQLLQEIAENPDVLELCNSHAVAIVFGDEVFKSKHAPSNTKILKIGRELYSRNNVQFHTNKLVDFLPAEDCEEMAGIIFHPLHSHNFVLWFRPETITEVDWAGDPNKAILKDENGLSPRNSFKLWKEFVKCQSNPWLRPELNAAANFAHSIQIRINLIMLTEQQKRNFELNETLKETNSELENINWISTHDLQEPLRKIQLNASRLLIKNENIPENIVQDIVRMSDSAARMQTLLTDILKYTKIQHTEGKPSLIDISPILEEVIEELQEHSVEKNAEITVENVPEIYGIPFLIKQLFSNLLNNSLKFAAESRPSKITIRAGAHPIQFNSESDALYDTIIITDNGIGFESQFDESIFNIFKRLNGQTQYRGSGVGLALCKKIMKAHNGHISAKGQDGIGATFTLYFPIINISKAS